MRSIARAVLAGALALGALAPVEAHAPGDGSLPRLELTIRIDERAVVEDLHLPLDLYAREALGAVDLEGFRAVGRGERLRRLAVLLAERCPVSVDGVHVLPRLEELEVQVPDEAAVAKARERAAASAPAGSLPAEIDPIQLGGIVVRASYETKGRPDLVRIEWNLFPVPDPGIPEPEARFSEPDSGADPPMERSVVAEIDGFGRRRLEVFTPESSTVLWQREAKPVLPIAAPPEPEAFSSPLLIGVTVVLFAAGLLCLAAAIIRRGAAWSLLAGCFVLAALASVPLAFGWGLRFGLTLPPDAALDVFRGLHRNIYRAFDYVAESDVYDTLARSVDGPQLDEIYRGIYESLILRDDGDAVCKIERVEMLETELVDLGSLAEGSLASDLDRGAMGTGASSPKAGPHTALLSGGYGVRARWRVTGFVRHWGHSHRRVRELAAVYAVAPRDGAWKIVASHVLREEDVSRDGAPRADAPREAKPGT